MRDTNEVRKQKGILLGSLVETSWVSVPSQLDLERQEFFRMFFLR